MIDIEKQIIYWRDGAVEDWEVACELVQRGRIRHGLFFAHLALEKALKAHVCRVTEDLAPRIHNLARLAEISRIGFQPEQLDVLAEMNAFNIEGRYPDKLSAPPTKKEALQYIRHAENVFKWLINRL